MTYWSERVYIDLLTNPLWSDGHQGVLDKPEYIFGDSKDCYDRHPSELVTLSFISNQREIVTVSTQDTYKRSSSALNLKFCMPDRNDGVIAWGCAESYFKTGSFKSDEPGFFVLVATKFDLLVLSTATLSSSSPISQLRTIILGILTGDGSLWIGDKHNPRGWFTPSKD